MELLLRGKRARFRSLEELNDANLMRQVEWRVVKESGRTADGYAMA